jgi:DNA-binding SARP family transcriptional activator
MTGKSSQASSGRQVFGGKAIELLGLGQYEELGELLWRVKLPDGDADRMLRVRLLDVARSICRAGSEVQAEAAWHEEVLARIAGREQELNGALKTVLDLLGRGAAEGARRREAQIQDSTTTSDTPDVSAFSWAGRLSPRQRVRSLTRRKSPSPGSESARPTAAAGEATLHESVREAHASPDIAVYCLGSFQVFFNDRLVEDWPGGKGKMIFKFLANQPDRAIAKEILMDLFWPDFDPDAARNNLNVAIYSLRQAFARISPLWSVVLFGSDCYFLNPDLDIWIDHEQFIDHLAAARVLEQQGDLSLAMNEYRSAGVLYRGEFLEEDRYEDWPGPLRRSLRDDYLALLDWLGNRSLELENYADCVDLCNKTLAIDACHEKSHRRLMTCWSRQGLPHLAVRQYHVCRDALAGELEFRPSEMTESLLKRIRRRELV